MSNSKTIKWIIATPFILISVGIAFCEANKAYWDHQVKLMCEKDGGVTVYEKVEISKKDYPNMKFISTGQPILPFDYHAKKEDPFYLKDETTFLHTGFPDVMRFEQSIIRNNDKKILSIHISYGRRGGDFPTGFHLSHFLCGSEESDLRAFSETIKIKGE